MYRALTTGDDPYKEVILVNRHEKLFRPDEDTCIQIFDALTKLVGDVAGIQTPAMGVPRKMAPRWPSIEIMQRYIREMIRCVRAGRPMQYAIHATPGTGKTLIMITLLLHPAARGLALLGANFICTLQLELAAQIFEDIHDCTNSALWWTADVDLRVACLCSLSDSFLIANRVAGKPVEKIILKTIPGSDEIDTSDEYNLEVIRSLRALAEDPKILLVIVAVNRSFEKLIRANPIGEKSILFGHVLLDEGDSYSPSGAWNACEHAALSVKSVSLGIYSGSHRILCDPTSAEIIYQGQKDLISVIGDVPLGPTARDGDEARVIVPVSDVILDDELLHGYKTEEATILTHLEAAKEKPEQQEERASQIYARAAAEAAADQRESSILAHRDQLEIAMRESNHIMLCRPPVGCPCVLSVTLARWLARWSLT